MNEPFLSRREFMNGPVVGFLACGAMLGRPKFEAGNQSPFSVQKHGAKGDGKAKDTR